MKAEEDIVEKRKKFWYNFPHFPLFSPFSEKGTVLTLYCIILCCHNVFTPITNNSMVIFKYEMSANLNMDDSIVLLLCIGLWSLTGQITLCEKKNPGFERSLPKVQNSLYC